MAHHEDSLCGNPDCACAKPGLVCREFLEYHGPYCIRCGWEKEDHAVTAPRCSYTIRDNAGVEQCEDDAEPDSDYCARHNDDPDYGAEDYDAWIEEERKENDRLHRG